MAQGLQNRYDATSVGFLPVISGFRAQLLGLALGFVGLPQQAQESGVAPSPTAGFTVVVGSGELRAGTRDEVGSAALAKLGELQPHFAGLQLRPFVIAVHESGASMPESLQRFLHAGTAAFTLLGQRQIHLVWGEMARSGTSLHAIVAHELVHELLDQWLAPRGAVVPRWFHEGLAQVMSGETYLGAREQDLLWRVGADRLLPFADLRDGFPLAAEPLQVAYAQSHSYVAWLVGRFGLQPLLAIVANTDRHTTFERALSGGTGWTSLQLQEGWLDHLRRGSGAWSRIALEQSFHVLLLASVPLLWLALRRRNARERRAATRLDQLARWQIEELARARAAAAAEAASSALPGPADSSPPAASPPADSPPDRGRDWSSPGS